jgi:hypothetical protein
LVVGSGVLVVVGLVLLGVVTVGCSVLIVGCLLWLFCDVGVWLVTWWYGYVHMCDKPLEAKRVISVGLSRK